MNKKAVSVITTVLLTASAALSGCGSSAPSSATPSAGSTSTASATPGAAETPKAPTPLSILINDGGRIVKEDNEVWKELERRTNTELNLMMLSGNDLQQKVNTMAASNDLPDIIQFKDFYPYAAQGVMLDIGELVEKYGSNIKAKLPEELWEFTKYQDKQVAIPYYNEAGKYVMAIRQDWLDTVGKAIPTNLDELYDVAVAFATQDPDKNGTTDTYAFGNWDDFMPVFGAFGIIGGPASGQQRYYYVEDNKVFTTVTSPQYKEALAYIKKLWDAKVIDPDFVIMQTDQYRQKLAQGKIGLLNGWWSIVPDVLYTRLGFSELNPNGSWSIIEKAPEGPGGPFGTSGMRSAGDFQNATWLSSSTKYPVEAIQFLDYLISDEGYELTAYGIQGVHYTAITEPRTEAGQTAYDERWLDSFNQIVGRRLDLLKIIRDAATDDHQKEMNRYTEAALAYNLYLDAFFGLPSTEEELEYNTDLNAFEIESRIAFITGHRSLDQYDQYVQEWLSRGGQKIIESKVKQHNELKGTSYELGAIN